MPVINFTESDTVIQTVNYDALSIWEKLKAAPKYKRTQQIMALLVDKMNTQSFQNFYYSIYAYEEYFKD